MVNQGPVADRFHVLHREHSAKPGTKKTLKKLNMGKAMMVSQVPLNFTKIPVLSSLSVSLIFVTEFKKKDIISLEQAIDRRRGPIAYVIVP